MLYPKCNFTCQTIPEVHYPDQIVKMDLQTGARQIQLQVITICTHAEKQSNLVHGFISNNVTVKLKCNNGINCINNIQYYLCWAIMIFQDKLLFKDPLPFSNDCITALSPDILWAIFKNIILSKNSIQNHWCRMHLNTCHHSQQFTCWWPIPSGAETSAYRVMIKKGHIKYIPWNMQMIYAFLCLLWLGTGQFYYIFHST